MRKKTEETKKKRIEVGIGITLSIPYVIHIFYAFFLQYKQFSLWFSALHQDDAIYIEAQESTTRNQHKTVYKQ